MKPLSIRAYDHNDRASLERAILGAVLLEGGAYSRVADFLSAKNFQISDHKKIWKAFEMMWPTKPIDFTSVHHFLLGKGERLHELLANCQQSVNSSSSLEYWCLLLVELDIASKLAGTIEKTQFDNSEVAVQQAAQELYFQLIDEKTDILKVITDAGEYFGMHFPDQVLTIQIQEFHGALEVKAMRIKERIKVRTLFKELELLGNGDFKRKMAVDYLSDMLLAVIASPTVSDQLMSKILETKKLIES